MNQRDPAIRAAFAPTDDDPGFDHGGGWNRLLRARAAAARRRAAAWGTLIVLVVIGAFALGRFGPSWSALGSKFVPEGVVTDSIMPQASEAVGVGQTKADEQRNLLQLMDYRRELRSELDGLRGRMSAIEYNLAENPNHLAAPGWRKELQAVEAQMEAVNQDIRLLDREMAQATNVPVLTGTQSIAVIPSAPMIIGGGGMNTETLTILYGMAGVVLLLLVLMVRWVRRTTTATVKTLSAMQAQAVAQHETLTAGIEAIALEVERLGEGQRYMSKLVVGGAPQQVGELRRPGDG